MDWDEMTQNCNQVYTRISMYTILDIDYQKPKTQFLNLIDIFSSVLFYPVWMIKPSIPSNNIWDRLDINIMDILICVWYESPQKRVFLCQ